MKNITVTIIFSYQGMRFRNMDLSRKDIMLEGRETCWDSSTVELPVDWCSQQKTSGTSKSTTFIHEGLSIHMTCSALICQTKSGEKGVFVTEKGVGQRDQCSCLFPFLLTYTCSTSMILWEQNNKENKTKQKWGFFESLSN